MKLTALIMASVLIPIAIFAGSITGKVIGISDGDTITVLDESSGKPVPTKIRLSEIDTPESKQAFGSKAKQALSEKIFGKVVKVEYRSKDRYGRVKSDRGYVSPIIITDEDTNEHPD
jgi:endonuclease YncB( thermonuclease family)